MSSFATISMLKIKSGSLHESGDNYLDSLRSRSRSLIASASPKHSAAGALMRGHPWRIQKVSDLLSDRTYRGEYRYNMRDSRSGLLRPESEWVRCAVEPIVDDATFEAARRLREQSDPKADTPVHAKRAAIPTLLTGILFCENCGASMTLPRDGQERALQVLQVLQQDEYRHQCLSDSERADGADGPSHSRATGRTGAGAGTGDGTVEGVAGRAGEAGYDVGSRLAGVLRRHCVPPTTDSTISTLR